MRFLNPKTDFAFKKIFGSPESGDILVSFLNAMLDLHGDDRVASVQILDPCFAPPILGIKNTYVDVRATDQAGRQHIIEMQVINHRGLEERVLYNACKAVAGQLQEGVDYIALQEVVSLVITDFEMFPEVSGLRHSFRLRTADGRTYNDKLQLVFVELPKFGKQASELSDTFDRWAYFLREARKLDEIPPELASDADVAHAMRLANLAGMSAEDLEAHRKREDFLYIVREGYVLARQQGEAAGEARGEARGIEIGATRARDQTWAEAVARLVATGMTESQARAMLGMPQHGG